MDYATHCAILPPNPTAIFKPEFALREGPSVSSHDEVSPSDGERADDLARPTEMAAH
jgi:hypothetical protein